MPHATPSDSEEHVAAQMLECLDPSVGAATQSTIS